MSVAVASLGCDRKRAEGFPSWSTLFELQGDIRLYFNYQYDEWNDNGWYEASEICSKASMQNERSYSFDLWSWKTLSGYWRRTPKFDQDQARLSSIVCARNMAIEFAYQTDASHLLFIDADIIPQRDIVPKLLEVNKLTVGGLVHGRGVHSNCPYIFQEKGRTNMGSYQLVECEHGNIGFCMIARRAFEQIRFRYGLAQYPDGRSHVVSDDPAYHLDVQMKFGEMHFIRMDVVGQHVGDLKANETSQF